MSVIWDPTMEEELSFSFWKHHLRWLSDEIDWKEAESRKSMSFPLQPTHHRIVDRLRRFVEGTGFVNAHFGLTSSDIEDNVRRTQLQHAWTRCRHLLHLFCDNLRRLGSSIEQDVKTNAYTHWQLAGVVPLHHRIYAWITPLENMLPHTDNDEQCRISGKLMAGPVGDFSDVQQLLAYTKSYSKRNTYIEIVHSQLNHFPWFFYGLVQPWNIRPIQSSDHFDEEKAIAWITRATAHLSKIALDWRFLHSHGEMEPIQPEGYVGSSSIPSKSNPFKWEKACSIARVIMPAHRGLLDVIANNGCERTLDTSWQIRKTLEQTTLDFERLLTTLMELDFAFTPKANPGSLSETREEKTERIILGATRAEVYLT